LLILIGGLAVLVGGIFGIAAHVFNKNKYGIVASILMEIGGGLVFTALIFRGIGSSLSFGYWVLVFLSDLVWRMPSFPSPQSCACSIKMRRRAKPPARKK
jgi:hypothetical protein